MIGALGGWYCVRERDGLCVVWSVRESVGVGRRGGWGGVIRGVCDRAASSVASGR